MHEAACDLQAAAHPAREREDGVVRAIGEPDPLKELFRAGPNLRAGHAEEFAVKDEVLARGQALVNRRVLEDDPDLAAHGPGVLADLVAADVGLARGGREQRAEHRDGGGLAGSVGTEEAEDLGLPYLERDVVDRGDLAEVAREVGDPDGRGHPCIIVVRAD